MDKEKSQIISWTIIYGYENGFLKNYISETNEKIIIIEPRSKKIDEYISSIYNREYKNIIFIKKALNTADILKEDVIYYNEEKYYIDEKKIDITKFKRQKTYTTSLGNIIKDYKIKNIKKIIFNINVSNIDDILGKISSYNHIISNIYIKESIDLEQIKNFNKTDEITKISEVNFKKYCHKNINIKLPKIYSFENKINYGDIRTEERFKTFLLQYDITNEVYNAL
jgi:hypothetical protein